MFSINNPITRKASYALQEIIQNIETTRRYSKHYEDVLSEQTTEIQPPRVDLKLLRDP